MASDADFAALLANPDALRSAIGFDTNRLWVTSCGISRGDGVSIFVLKENLTIAPPVPSLQPVSIERNVGSLVMPDGAARALRDALLEVYPLDPS